MDIKGLQVNLYDEKDKTPFILVEISAFNTEDKDETLMFYGHFDKQPHLDGWDDGLGPTKPVIRDGKLYGRGGADDGYSIYAVLTALKMIQDQNLPH